MPGRFYAPPRHERQGGAGTARGWPTREVNRSRRAGIPPLDEDRRHHADRHVGSRVTRLLLQAGVRPTVLLRDPAGLDEQTRAHVDAVACDLLDPDAFLRATEGADALYWVDPPVGEGDPIAGYVRAGTNGMFFTNLLLDPPALDEGVLRVTWPVDAVCARRRRPPVTWPSMPHCPGSIPPRRRRRRRSPPAGGRLGRAARCRRCTGPSTAQPRQVAAVVSRATGRTLRAEQTRTTMRGALRAAGLGDVHRWPRSSAEPPDDRCERSRSRTTRCAAPCAPPGSVTSRSKRSSGCRPACARTSCPRTPDDPHDDPDHTRRLGARATYHRRRGTAGPAASDCRR